LASWQAEAVAAPAPSRTRARPKPKQKPRTSGRARARARQRARHRAAILWILVSALLLAGVVTVNLAVLRLNLSLDKATQERSKLRSDNAALQSQLSSELASPRIQSKARRQLGLVDADGATIGYLDLAPKGH
jgi:cell division protein FtsL